MIMPRPTKLTEEITRILVESAKLGMKREHCADRAGISVGTLYNWLAKGKRGEKRYKEFFERIKKATADGIAFNLAIIQKEAKTNWHCSAWLLERCHSYHRNPLEDAEEHELIDIQNISVKDLLQEIEDQNEKLKQFLGPEIKD